MVAATITAEASAPAPVRTIDCARHPVARRLADVLRSRSGNPRVFIIDDQENIDRAVRCGIEMDSLYATASVAERVLPDLAAGVDPGTPRYVLGDDVARSVFGGQKHARSFALARAPRPARLGELVGTSGDVIVLDGVRLVGNIGAITRTACALGSAGVVLLDSGLRTVLDRRLIRASRGLVFEVLVVIGTHAQLASFVRRENLPLATLCADAGGWLSSIRTVPERLALLMGGERGGVSGELDALASYRYAIPMTARVESLNESVAAGIALYEHRNQGSTPVQREGELFFRDGAAFTGLGGGDLLDGDAGAASDTRDACAFGPAAGQVVRDRDLGILHPIAGVGTGSSTCPAVSAGAGPDRP